MLDNGLGGLSEAVPVGQSPAHRLLFCTLLVESLRILCARGTVHRYVTRVRVSNAETGRDD